MSSIHDQSPNVHPSFTSPVSQVKQEVRTVKSEKSTSSLDQSIQAVSKDPVNKISEAFKKCLIVRTFSDESSEAESIKSKKEHESDPTKKEKYYWSSASMVKEGFKCKVWEGNNDRCGLVISPDAEIGGWGMYDMGTDNVPSTVTDEDTIKGYFPNHFPDIVLSPLVKELENYNLELASKILGLDQSITSPTHCGKAKDYVLERLEPTHPEHRELLSRLPAQYKSCYDIENVKLLMDQQRATSSGIVHEYNEGKIHYQSKDILGVFVFNNPESIQKGMRLMERLAESGIQVPFVTYRQTKGDIEIYQTPELIPTVRQELQSIIPKDPAELQALKTKYYTIAEGNNAPHDTDEELLNWLKEKSFNGELGLGQEDREIICDHEFPKIVKEINGWIL